MSISVVRGGATSREWSGKGWAAAIKNSSMEKSVKVGFKIDAGGRGGGVTDVEVSIKKGSFDDLAQAMIEADPTAAIRAFAYAMKDYSAD